MFFRPPPRCARGAEPRLLHLNQRHAVGRARCRSRTRAAGRRRPGAAALRRAPPEAHLPDGRRRGGDRAVNQRRLRAHARLVQPPAAALGREGRAAALGGRRPHVAPRAGAHDGPAHARLALKLPLLAPPLEQEVDVPAREAQQTVNNLFCGCHAAHAAANIPITLGGHACLAQVQRRLTTCNLHTRADTLKPGRPLTHSLNDAINHAPTTRPRAP